MVHVCACGIADREVSHVGKGRGAEGHSIGLGALVLALRERYAEGCSGEEVVEMLRILFLGRWNLASEE